MAESIDFFSIRIEQTDWQTSEEILSSIRRTVFIEEQHVPVEEEFDQADLTATHWIAWGEGDTPMGVARLVGNKLGRMAVLEPHRHKGVASSLVRSIIAFAISEKMDHLKLDAQLHAVGLYENSGFEITGEEFEDVGIPHLPMKIDLTRFGQRPQQPQLPEINEQHRKRQLFDNREDCRAAALSLARHSNRTIRIFSEQLDPRIYDNDDFCQAIYNLVIAHPHTKVLILIKETDGVVKHFHRLVEIFYKLTSHIEIRKLTQEIPTIHQEFMSGDVTSLLYLQDPKRYIGYLCLHTPLETKHLNEEFDALWHRSQPDPQIRRLHI